MRKTVMLTIFLASTLNLPAATINDKQPLVFKKLGAYYCEISYSVQFASNPNTKRCWSNDRAATEIQVMDAEDYPLIWFCYHSTYMSDMPGAAKNEFFCGWVMASSIVTSNGAPVSQNDLRAIAQKATFSRVRKLQDVK